VKRNYYLTRFAFITSIVVMSGNINFAVAGVPNPPRRIAVNNV